MQADGLPFADVLSEEQIERAFEEEPERPDWMDQETYNRLPDQITVREMSL